MPRRARSIPALLTLGTLLILSCGRTDERLTAPARSAFAARGGGAATLSAIGLSPATVAAGGTATATVTLTKAAPAGGIVVGVTSSDVAVATTPASVTVAAGSTSASFTVTAQPVTSPGVATITATA